MDMDMLVTLICGAERGKKTREVGETDRMSSATCTEIVGVVSTLKPLVHINEVR